MRLAHVRLLLSIDASACAIRSQGSLVARRISLRRLMASGRIAIVVTPFAFQCLSAARFSRVTFDAGYNIPMSSFGFASGAFNSQTVFYSTSLALPAGERHRPHLDI